LAGAVPLATVVRSGVVESVHLGHVAVCDTEGRLVASTGDPDRVLFARSSMKPLQAAVSRSRIVEELPAEELAIMCASHNGESVHVAAALSVLRRAELDESALRCPPAWPWHVEDARGLEAPARRFHNCSGKHAGMLLAAASSGEQLDTYCDPIHPLQLAVRDAVVRMSGHRDVEIGVDGCGVPVHAMPLRAMATLFARVGNPPVGEPLAADLAACTGAMREHAYLVAGRDRADTALMDSVRGLVTKGGAEGLACAAAPERGVAVAVRIDDGGPRAAAPALIRALALLEILTEDQLDVLERFARPPVTGGDRPVGTLTSTFSFDR
jgi:L-asparaginase II